MISLLLAVTIAFGRLPQSDAALPNVGNCTFLDYYCTLREYESHFFKKWHQGHDFDCGLQFWILYYRSFQKAVTCGSATEPMDTANIREIQTIYCYGLDLEIPLLFSLSPCSSSLKDKVVQCTREFSNLFKFNILSNNMCRVRAKAKLCVAMAWQVSCAPSDVVKGISDKVIGGFNPFCTGDRDPWSTKIDSCAPYRIPYREPVCQDCKCNTQDWSGDGRGNQKASDDDEEPWGVLFLGIGCPAVFILIIIGLKTCYPKFRRYIEDLLDRAEVP